MNQPGWHLGVGKKHENMAWGRQSHGGPQWHPRGTLVSALSGPEGCGTPASPVVDSVRSDPTGFPPQNSCKGSCVGAGEAAMPYRCEDTCPALIPSWKGAAPPSPARHRGPYLLHRCPSTLSLQVQCPVLGSQVPTLPAGSQAQGLDGETRRQEVTPSPVPPLPHRAGLLLTCSRPRSGCGTRPCSARTSSPSRWLCTGRSPSCHTGGAGTLQGPRPALRLNSSRENTRWGDGETPGVGELTKTIPPSCSKGRGFAWQPHAPAGWQWQGWQAACGSQR